MADLSNYRLSAVASTVLAMGAPNDLSLAVPGSGPVVAATGIAGSNPEPMDDDSFRQPVVAYFTFIQNNLAQLTSGNAQQVRGKPNNGTCKS